MREESCTFSFRQRWEKAKTGDAASRMALSICETDNITVITFCNYAVMVKCKSILKFINLFFLKIINVSNRRNHNILIREIRKKCYLIIIDDRHIG